MGLWQRTTTSARCASSAFEATTSPPSSSASAWALAESTSATSTGSPMPRASADAMLPAPIRPIFIAPRLYRRAADAILRLVEEALLDQPRALLGRHLDVAWREE